MDDGATLGLRLVWALKPYWITSGQLALGQQMTLEALAHPGAGERNVARSRGLFDAGQIAVLMGRYQVAQVSLEESLEIAQEIGDMRMKAMVLQPLGVACMGQSNMAAACIHLEEAVVMAGALGNKREIAASVSALAQFLRMTGKLDSAEPLYSQSLAIARELQDHEYIAITLLNLAMVSIDRNNGERVPKMLLESLAIADEIAEVASVPLR